MGAVWEPKISNIDEFPQMPEDMIQEVTGEAKGFYNEYLPIFALNVRLLSADEEKIAYKTNYFPFGSREVELTKENGNNWIFNETKPLTGLQ